ncbi:MAG: sulfur oxidation c-type cytochrome SoxX [Proteobacteria bacterium]|nr:sulfur oxidation c-type cytochrome SoxX [Pseudomonadota bacterium]MDA0876706.1 sulfur oxidation c-type cytochrome SoxX [Pseudomonadota bacterium]MDA1186529.1 sulfur oxidation c-type cytochrome SoxX [Pseudomonadota bacterium]
MKTITKITIGFSAAVVLAGCAVTPDYNKMTVDMLKRSFETKHIATVDRLNQDEVNRVCSDVDMTGKDVDPAVRKRLEAAQLAAIKYPADGKFLGDWKKAEKIAQSGNGLTWKVLKAGTPNGGNCYNCHQITKKEISYGSIGPSLYQYGKLRGNSEAVLKYTWGKLYNAKAYNLCSNMPRFGHAGILTDDQMKDLMAYLLDPNSPVNTN